jgi:hypothetical protein
MGKLVFVASFLYPFQADSAKSKLESEGISAFVSDEHIVQMNWTLSHFRSCGEGSCFFSRP